MADDLRRANRGTLGSYTACLRLSMRVCVCVWVCVCLVYHRVWCHQYNNCVFVKPAEVFLLGERPIVTSLCSTKPPLPSAAARSHALLSVVSLVRFLSCPAFLLSPTYLHPPPGFLAFACPPFAPLLFVLRVRDSTTHLPLFPLHHELVT